MSMKEYSLKLTLLFIYAPIIVEDSREKRNFFMGVTDHVVKTLKMATLNNA